uniref:Conserved domain protein n=1 Tax=Parastrongyloides trichosuri TaxID=131310 RepID=A0A0N4ZQC5_PARTI
MVDNKNLISKELLESVRNINAVSTELDKAWEDYLNSLEDIKSKYPHSNEFTTYDMTNKAQMGIVLSKMISLFGGDNEAFDNHMKELRQLALSLATDQMEDIPKYKFDRINKKAFSNIFKNATFDIEEYNKEKMEIDENEDTHENFEEE